MAAENLGEILVGDTIENSPYELLMGQEETCKVLCRRRYSKKDVKKFVERIDEEYSVNWVVDNLPAATKFEVGDEEDIVMYDHGYMLGGHIYEEGKSPLDAVWKGAKVSVSAWFLHNHLSITIKTHSSPDYDGRRVVEVNVEPKSVQHSHADWKEGEQPKYMTVEAECVDPSDSLRPPMIIKGDGVKTNDNGEVVVVWTYDVKWEESPIRWASRWDIYLSMNRRFDSEVHWFSIINAILVIVLLAGVVGIILIRTLRKDVLYYNRVLTEEERLEEKEESGWKLVHGDVFRPVHPFPMLFSVMIGTATQLYGMSCVTLIFAALGFLSPANRGSLMIALVSLFVLMGSGAGYAAGRTYKNAGGKEWQRCIVATAFAFPSFAFGVFFVVNLAVWYEGSAAAVPFTSMFAILALWLGISVPLTFMGAYFAFKQPSYEPATTVSPYKRAIPKQHWFMRGIVTIPIAGALPFGAVFVEIYAIMSSLWLDEFYYLYGFLILVFCILILTCSLVTIVMTYFQLCAEDYRWWWRSFATSGSVALYVWLFCVYYFYTKLDMVLFVSSVVYFAYMFLLCIGMFLVTGLAGYVSTFWFVHLMYGALKVD